MDHDALRRRMLTEISRWEVIDCHEHLPEEEERLATPVDAMTLFSHYTHNDLITAGMARADYDRLFDHAVPLDERWALVKPYWERIRFTGYSRPVLLAIQRFYGCDDLTEATYQVISERMQAENTPGIYGRVLRDACHIRLCLTQIGRVPHANRDLLVPLLPCGAFASAPGADEVQRRAAAYGMTVDSLADFVEIMRRDVHQAREDGAVGLKMSAQVNRMPARGVAEAAFRHLMAGYEHDRGVLDDYLLGELLEIADDENLVVAVHCGLIWTNWQNFTQLHPRHMIPLLMAHPRTRFDLYHAGLPWMRETGAIGKSFPNVWLNLCWTHIMAPAMTASALNEWLEMVPYTKILGFGGDYGKPVEKVYGHLQLALRNIATVLAGRVAEGWMTEDEALRVAHAWLWDNPVELYRLGV